MAQLERRNIVRVYDVVDCEFDGDQWKFLIMELLTGGTARDHVTQFGPMDPRQAVEVVLEVLDALRAVHSKKVIHRDIKPENILLSGEGVVKLADFGIAFAPRDRTRLTVQGSTMGTEVYMAPEQREDASSATTRSDIYSVGVVLWVLLIGREPYAPPGYNNFFQNVERNPLWFDGIPDELKQIIMIATSEDPQFRFDSAQAMEDELRAVLPLLASTPSQAPKLGSAPEAKRAKEAREQMTARNLADLADDGDDSEIGNSELGVVEYVRHSPVAVSVSGGLEVSSSSPGSTKVPLSTGGRLVSEEVDDGFEEPPLLNALPSGTLSDARPLSETRMGKMMDAEQRTSKRNFAILVGVVGILAVGLVSLLIVGKTYLFDGESGQVEEPVQIVSTVEVEPVKEPAKEDLTTPELPVLDPPEEVQEAEPAQKESKTPVVAQVKVEPKQTEPTPPREVKVNTDSAKETPPPETTPVQKGMVRLVPKQVMEVDDPEAPEGKRSGVVTYVLSGTKGEGTFTLSSTRSMAQVPHGTYQATVSFEGRSQNQTAPTIKVDGALTTVECFWTMANCRVQ